MSDQPDSSSELDINSTASPEKVNNEMTPKELVEIARESKPYVAEELGILNEHHEGSVVHSEGVAYVSAALAIHEGFSYNDAVLVTRSGLVHDRGKTEVDIEILKKEGPLTAEEYNQVKTHVVSGYDWIGHKARDMRTAKLFASHHAFHQNPERDYPKIDMFLPDPKDPDYSLQRVIALADLVHALGSDRTYKKAYPSEQIRSIVLGDFKFVEWDAQQQQEVPMELGRQVELIDVAIQACGEYEASLKKVVSQEQPSSEPLAAD